MTSRRLTPLAVYGVLFFLIVSFALLPLIGAITATMVGNAAGCRVDEAGSYPCIVYGSDIGHMLSTLFVLGWLMFVTFPIAAFLFLIWLVAIVIHLTRRARARQP